MPHEKKDGQNIEIDQALLEYLQKLSDQDMAVLGNITKIRNIQFEDLTITICEELLSEAKSILKYLSGLGELDRQYLLDILKIINLSLYTSGVKEEFLKELLEEKELLAELLKQKDLPEAQNPYILNPNDLEFFFNLPYDQKFFYLTIPQVPRENFKNLSKTEQALVTPPIARSLNESMPGPYETPEQEHFYNELSRNSPKAAAFYLTLASDAKDIYMRLSDTQREVYANLSLYERRIVNGALEKLFEEKNELLLEFFPEAVEILLRRTDPSDGDRLIGILNNLIEENFCGLNPFYTNLFMNRDNPLASTKRRIQDDVTLHTKNIKESIDNLDNITDSSYIKEILMRYGTDDFVQRATCDSSGCDWSIITNNVLKLADFYRTEILQRDWMNAIAASYTSGCVNQPYFGVMLLEAGRMLATESNNQNDIPEGLIFLYILEKAKNIVSQDGAIKPSLQAEATNLLVLECLKKRAFVTDRNLALEPTIVNARLLQEPLKKWIQDEAQELAKLTFTLNNNDIAEFLENDFHIEARTIWAGAVIPNLIESIKTKYRRLTTPFKELLINLYDLDVAALQNVIAKHHDIRDEINKNNNKNPFEIAQIMMKSKIDKLNNKEVSLINKLINQKIKKYFGIAIKSDNNITETGNGTKSGLFCKMLDNAIKNTKNENEKLIQSTNPKK